MRAVFVIISSADSEKVQNMIEVFVYVKEWCSVDVFFSLREGYGCSCVVRLHGETRAMDDVVIKAARVNTSEIMQSHCGLVSRETII